MARLADRVSRLQTADPGDVLSKTNSLVVRSISVGFAASLVAALVIIPVYAVQTRSTRTAREQALSALRGKGEQQQLVEALRQQVKQRDGQIDDLKAALAKAEETKSTIASTSVPAIQAPAPGKSLVMITALDSLEGTSVLSVDSAKILQGAEASAAATADRRPLVAPGLYVQNRVHDVRTLPMARNADVILWSWKTTRPKARHVKLEDLKRLFTAAGAADTHWKSTVFWITVKNDVVTKIEEQYLPRS